MYGMEASVSVCYHHSWLCIRLVIIIVCVELFFHDVEIFQASFFASLFFICRLFCQFINHIYWNEFVTNFNSLIRCEFMIYSIKNYLIFTRTLSSNSWIEKMFSTGFGSIIVQNWNLSVSRVAVPIDILIKLRNLH